jgi:centrosomal protein CEP76
VIIINRLEKVLSPDDRGVINTFLTVSWRDQQKVTQVMKDNSNPTYNEELFFRMPLLKPELTLEDIINSKTIEQL